MKKLAYTVFISLIGLLVLSTRCPAQNRLVFTFIQDEILEADAGEDKEINLGESVTLGPSNILFGGSGVYSYQWEPTTGLDDPTKLNPIANPEETTTYTLFITDSKKCLSSDDVILTVNLVTGLNIQNSSIKVYPNPTKHKLTVSLGNEFVHEWIIRSINGVEVKKGLLESGIKDPLIISTSELKIGVYFLELRGNNNNQIFRFLITD